MNILIAGDSFAADWTVKYKNHKGWPNLLSDLYEVTNVAQAGVSEYKIYQQIIKIPDIQIYDVVIVSHTSPYRAVTRRHPLHYKDVLHKDSDLLLNDIEFHARSIKGWLNASLRAADSYLKYHYDIEYHETVYRLFRKEIDLRLLGLPTVVVNNFPWQPSDTVSRYTVDCIEIQKTHPGLINHLSNKGNQIVFDMVHGAINQILCPKT